MNVKNFIYHSTVTLDAVHFELRDFNACYTPVSENICTVHYEIFVTNVCLVLKLSSNEHERDAAWSSLSTANELSAVIITYCIAPNS